MLNLSTRDHKGIGRREFLRVGSLCAGGLSLAEMLRLRSNAVTAAESPTKTAVIQVFLCGGPSQHDTFDPKPSAPVESRGPFDSIATALPGVRITEFFPRLAAILDRCSLIRSVSHHDGSHNHCVHWLQTGYYPDNLVFGANHFPATGSVTAKYRGPNQPGMPPYVTIPEGPFYGLAGYLGAGYNPLEVGNPNLPDFAVPNLQLMPGLTSDRLDDRRQILQGLDRLRRETQSRGEFAAIDDFHTAAFEMLSGPAVRKAFDIGAEDPRLRDRYGRTRLGQSCLLARRLVEAGVTFVNVKDYEFMEWDLHGVTPETRLEPGTRLKGPHLDMALSSLILDLEERGLLDRVLVQVFGEFGRTPKINPVGGRDHWGLVFPALFAGGGLRHGQVIGSSDSQGAVPQDRPLRPADLLATMYRVLGISTQLTPTDFAGRPVPVLSQGEPIRELFA